MIMKMKTKMSKKTSTYKKSQLTEGSRRNKQ